MERHPTVQDLTDRRRDFYSRRQRLPITPPRDCGSPAQDSRSSSPKELFVMERIEEEEENPFGFDRVLFEAKIKENALVRRAKRIRAMAISLWIVVSVLAAYAVFVTVAVASTRAGWVDIGLCPTALSGDNQDRVVRSATPIALALQIKAQGCLSANGSFIRSTPDCSPICTVLPKAPECLPQDGAGQTTTTATPTPTGSPITTMGEEGEEEDSFGSSGRGVRTDQTPTPDDQAGDASATGRIDIRLIREREAADATVRRICLCSLGGQRGCRCEDNSEEWPIDIILVHHGKDVGIRLQDPNVWSMTF